MAFISLHCQWLGDPITDQPSHHWRKSCSVHFWADSSCLIDTHPAVDRSHHLILPISVINNQKAHGKTEQMIHIIKDSLQQVANMYKLKPRENGLNVVSPSFPGDKNNEAHTRRFQTLLERHLCLGNSCLPLSFKISIYQTGAMWCAITSVCRSRDLPGKYGLL